MYVGCQNFGFTQTELEFLVRHGVSHIDANHGLAKPLTLESLLEARQAAADRGVNLEMIHVLPSRAIILAQDPQRDIDIAEFNRWIEIAGKAGLRGLNYSFTVLTNQRTPDTPGRGGTSQSSFTLAKHDNSKLSEAGRVTRDEVFARMKYFLDRVIPTAEKWKVQLACHPDDPPAPILNGVERWDYPVFEGFKRFCELVDSPYHGLNLCCGTAAEGLEDPRTELIPIVKYFAERKKIFNIHFRNITGGLHDFAEVWPDEGDIDMFELAETLFDAGYEYMLMPDHAPTHPDDASPPGTSGRVKQAWAFQFGYM